jgi:hypothetical protein
MLPVTAEVSRRDDVRPLGTVGRRFGGSDRASAVSGQRSKSGIMTMIA